MRKVGKLLLLLLPSLQSRAAALAMRVKLDTTNCTILTGGVRVSTPPKKRGKEEMSLSLLFFCERKEKDRDD